MDIDENHIRVPHRRVFEINLRELCNFLEFEITNRQDGTELNPPMMEAATERYLVDDLIIEAYATRSFGLANRRMVTASHEYPTLWP